MASAATKCTAAPPTRSSSVSSTACPTAFSTGMNMNMNLGMGMGMGMGMLSVGVPSPSSSSSSTPSSLSTATSSSSCGFVTPRARMSTPAAMIPTGKIPKFLRSLYSILQTEDPMIVAWVQNQELKPNRVTAFHILNMPRFEKEVLPKYFKHQKFASFQRQLNNFGFRKWTKTQSSGVCTFSHNCFPPDPMHLSSLKASVREHWRQGIKKPGTPKQAGQSVTCGNTSSTKKHPTITTTKLTPLQLEEASRPHVTTTSSSSSSSEMMHFQDCPIGSQISPVRKPRLCPDLTGFRLQRDISPLDSSVSEFCAPTQQNCVSRHSNSTMVGMSISDLLVQDHAQPLPCASDALGVLSDPVTAVTHESQGAIVGAPLMAGNNHSSSLIYCDSFLKGMEEIENSLDSRSGFTMIDPWTSIAKRSDGISASSSMPHPTTLMAAGAGVGGAGSYAPSPSPSVDFGFPLVELDWNDSSLISCHQDRALPSCVENDYGLESLLFVE